MSRIPEDGPPTTERKTSHRRRSSASRPTGTTPSVFLSHSKTDVEWAVRLKADLEQYGAQVWIDHEEIRVGDQLQEEIPNSIAYADFFLVLLSKAALQSPWVRDEISTALALRMDTSIRGILPVRLEEVEIPPRLRSLRYADLADGASYRDVLRQLLAALGLAPREGLSVTASRPPPAENERPPRDDAERKLIYTLASLLPARQELKALCEKLSWARSEVIRDSGPVERWASLVAAARAQDRLEELLRATDGRLPLRRRAQLASGAATSALFDRARMEQVALSLAPGEPHFGPLDDPLDDSLPEAMAAADTRVHHQLGLLAINRYWSRPPAPPRTGTWKRELAEADPSVFQAARDEKRLTARGYFTDLDLGLAFAADFLARRSDEEPTLGHELIAWALPRLSSLSALCHEILIHFCAWWQPAGGKVATFLSEQARAGSDTADRRLLEITFAERLQREARLPLGPEQIRQPLAVQYARRQGLEERLVSVLEVLGEQRPELYIELWKLSAGPGRQQLARAAIRHAGRETKLGDPTLERARQAADPSTPAKDILAAVKDPKVLRLWFDILPIDPAEPQVEALVVLLLSPRRGKRAERYRLEAGELLARHPDLTNVWDALGNGRKSWMQTLEPDDLSRPNFSRLFEALRRRLPRAAEARDIELLRRLRQEPGGES